MSETFDRIQALPEGFFDIAADNICSLFPRPTLVELQGEDPRALFISILLHGNEFSGLEVMQEILQQYSNNLPRSILLFVGNVRAAEARLRFLPDQVDFNRCWPGSDQPPGDSSRMMQQVFDYVSAQPLFAAIDIHNNTGKNPHYSCITKPDLVNQNLAARFNNVALVFNRKGVSTMAFDDRCPAATLECGKPGDPHGILHACRFIEGLLRLEALPDSRPPREALHMVETRLRLNIPEEVSFEFDPSADADLCFDNNFEERNFTLVDTQQIFAYSRVARPLLITDADGVDVTDSVIHIEDGKVYLKSTMMPAMISHDKLVVRQDCLCYLMQDYPG